MLIKIFVFLDIFCLISVQNSNGDRITVDVKSLKGSDEISSRNTLLGDVTVISDSAEEAGLVDSQKVGLMDPEEAGLIVPEEAWLKDSEGAERQRKTEIDWSRNIDLSYLGTEIFGIPSETTGEQLEEWSPFKGPNPEEMGEYAEGDILVPINKRNGILGESRRWVNGVVPYTIESTFVLKEVKVIEQAIEMYHNHTCIRFRKREPSDTDYVSIVNSETGCWSSIGRISGGQKLNLQGPQCTTKIGTTLHELMHALGFLHEHVKPIRDDYVKIVWENIKEGRERNFDTTTENTTGFGVGYDYSSVMHYSRWAFTANGRMTLIPVDDRVHIGQRYGFSPGDIMKINAMYGCNTKPPKKEKTRSGSSRRKNRKRKTSMHISISTDD